MDDKTITDCREQWKMQRDVLDILDALSVGVALDDRQREMLMDAIGSDLLGDGCDAAVRIAKRLVMLGWDPSAFIPAALEAVANPTITRFVADLVKIGTQETVNVLVTHMPLEILVSHQSLLPIVSCMGRFLQDATEFGMALGAIAGGAAWDDAAQFLMGVAATPFAVRAWGVLGEDALRVFRRGPAGELGRLGCRRVVATIGIVMKTSGDVLVPLDGVAWLMEIAFRGDVDGDLAVEAAVQLCELVDSRFDFDERIVALTPTAVECFEDLPITARVNVVVALLTILGRGSASIVQSLAPILEILWDVALDVGVPTLLHALCGAWRRIHLLGDVSDDIRAGVAAAAAGLLAFDDLPDAERKLACVLASTAS